MRSLIAALGGAVFMLGFGAALAKPAPEPPSLADNATEDEVSAWSTRYIDSAPYVWIGTEPGRVAYFDPASLAKLDGGHLTGLFRTELFRPNRRKQETVRSTLERLEIDCSTYRLKVLRLEVHSRSNLQGSMIAPDTVDRDWLGPLPKTELTAIAVRQACALTSLVGSPDWAKAILPDPDGIHGEPLQAWIKAHLDTTGYLPAATESGVAVLYRPGDFSRTKDGRLAASIRTEFSLPVTSPTMSVRSMLQAVELDCEGMRYLTTSTSAFPGSNLLGEAGVYDRRDDYWTEAQAGTIDAHWIGALCTAAKDPHAPRTPSQIPSPASTAKADVAAWVEAYINTNGFVPLDADEVGASFYATDDLELLDGGNVLATIRVENFTRAADPGGKPRSSYMRMELDCKGARVRMTGGAAFSESNYEGVRHDVGAAGWSKRLSPTSYGGSMVQQVCSQRSLMTEAVDRDLAFPTPLRQSDHGAVMAWMDEHLDLTDYAYAGDGDDAAIFYSTKELERTRQDYVRIWTRTEFLRPKVIDGAVARSLRMLLEIDCDQQRSRTLATHAFPGSNLLGEPYKDDEAQAEWSFLAPRTLFSSVANGVCKLKDDADSEDADPANALPVSTGVKTL